MDGMLRQYIQDHGPEALIPKRKEPLTNEIIAQLITMPNGTIFGPRSTLQWERPGMESLRAMFAFCAQTGARKSEVSLYEEDSFGRHHLSMANVVWSISGVVYKSLTPGLRANMTEGDFAIVRPPPSKADQFGLHWGASPIYLPFFPNGASHPICAARLIADLEVKREVAEEERSLVPLFVGPDGARQPWRHNQLNAIFKKMLTFIVGAERAACYSMHSFRSYLACALLKAGASHATILAMLRWRSEDSLLLYARMNDEQYCEWLGKAAVAEVSSLRTTTAFTHAISASSAEGAEGRALAFQAFWQQEAAKQAADLAAPANFEAVPEFDNSVQVASLQRATRVLMEEAARGDAADAGTPRRSPAPPSTPRRR